MAKLSLTDIEAGYASVAALNDNFAAIEAAIENTVSRDGTTPNTLSSDLDMDGNALLNVGGLTVNGVDVADLATSADEAAASAAAALVSETNAAASEAVVVDAAGNLLYLEYEGAWTTATLYKVNNIIYESSSGGSYICLVEHTSGTFSTDLGNGYWGTLATKGAAGAGTGDMLKSENLSGLADYSVARSNMGLTIGTNVQAHNANLDTFSSKTFVDEDDMASDLDTAVPSQQSVKAYVDASVSGSALEDLLAPTAAGNIIRADTGTTWAQGPTVTRSAFSLSSAVSDTITDIPSWVDRIDITFSNISTNGTSGILIQLGDSGGIETTGYGNACSSLLTTSATITSSTSGFPIRLITAANNASGVITIKKAYQSGATTYWTCSGVLGTSTVGTITVGGSKALTGLLTQVKLGTLNGTDTFDTGLAHLHYQ